MVLSGKILPLLKKWWKIHTSKFLANYLSFLTTRCRCSVVSSIFCCACLTSLMFFRIDCVGSCCLLVRFLTTSKTSLISKVDEVVQGQVEDLLVAVFARLYLTWSTMSSAALTPRTQGDGAVKAPMNFYDPRFPNQNQTRSATCYSTKCLLGLVSYTWFTLFCYQGLLAELRGLPPLYQPEGRAVRGVQLLPRQVQDLVPHRLGGEVGRAEGGRHLPRKAVGGGGAFGPQNQKHCMYRSGERTSPSPRRRKGRGSRSCSLNFAFSSVTGRTQ